MQVCFFVYCFARLLYDILSKIIKQIRKSRYISLLCSLYTILVEKFWQYTTTTCNRNILSGGGGDNQQFPFIAADY